MCNSIDEVKEIMEKGGYHYNHYRQHDALGGYRPMTWLYGQQANAQGSAIPDHITTSEYNRNSKSCSKK